MPTPLEDLGFTVVDVIAGFMGGVTRIFVFGAMTPLQACGSAFVGAMTANYLAPTATSYLHLPEAPAAFVVGLAGMQIALSITNYIKSWKPKGGGNGTGDSGSGN